MIESLWASWTACLALQETEMRPLAAPQLREGGWRDSFGSSMFLVGDHRSREEKNIQRSTSNAEVQANRSSKHHRPAMNYLRFRCKLPEHHWMLNVSSFRILTQYKR